MAVSECSIQDCGKPAKKNGWCVTHYERWRRTGDPTFTHYIHGDPVRRFWVKVDKSGDCWEWAASKSEDGYGYFRLDGKTRKAHRVAYEYAHGTVPDGMDLDHVCRNRACVRPDHLRPVSNKQNAEHRDPKGKGGSGYRSVHWHKARGKWAVCVHHNGERRHGGYFADVHEAGIAARDLRNALYTHNELDRKIYEPSDL